MSQAGIIETTHNNRGYMHEPSPISQRFFEFAKETKGTLLDIGCASGVNTIPALESGASVVGFDLDATHLVGLQNNAGNSLGERLTVVEGLFPDDLNFVDSSFDGVIISQVLGFVDGPKISEGFQKIANLLKPGGKIFIINYTIFTSITAAYLNEYEKRKENGDLWPGHVKDLAKYCKNKVLLENLPNALNLMDKDILERELYQAGFEIESSEYIGGDLVPAKFQLSGREWIGIVANKPTV